MGDRMVFFQLQIHATLEVPCGEPTLGDALMNIAGLKLADVFEQEVRVVCHSAEIVGVTLEPGHAENASESVVSVD